MDYPIFVSTRYVHAPRIAADLAALKEAAVDIGLYVNPQVLATKRTRHSEVVWHFAAILLQRWSGTGAGVTGWLLCRQAEADHQC
jgi:hypothetical protein